MSHLGDSEPTNTRKSNGRAGINELNIWNRQDLTMKGIVADIAIPKAVPVCQEVRIWPSSVSLRRRSLNPRE